MNVSHNLLSVSLSLTVLVLGAQAQWMEFTGGPTTATGNWIGASSLSGSASVTASNFINGNNSTGPIGLTPFNQGSLSVDFYNAGLTHNPGNILPTMSTPFNDTGDKYHVEFDFLLTSGSSSSGVLPAGTTMVIFDMDISENYRNLMATDAANNPIATAWLTPVQAYVDASTPLFNGGNVAPWQPTVNHSVGIYDLFGNPGNFDAGLLVFQTTQDVRTIALDMEIGGVQGNLGGGGAAIGFFAPVPEPQSGLLLVFGISTLVSLTRRRSPR